MQKAKKDRELGLGFFIGARVPSNTKKGVYTTSLAKHGCEQAT